jgi:hypothetical protein
MRVRPARITDGLLQDVACSVTDRDREILRLIRWHRVLTTNQVATMFFSDRNTAQHRLTRLYELRLVERFRPFRSGREGEYHYVLDQLGTYIVAAMRRDDPDAEVKVRWRTDQALAIAQSQRLAHTVGANDLFVQLVGAARHRADAQLSTWWGEHYCNSRFGGIVYPDGMGTWREGEDAVTFILEYDRGTEPLGRLAQKAAEYARLETVWDSPPFWVLAVVPGPRREQGVRDALGRNGLAVAVMQQGFAYERDDGRLQNDGEIDAPRFRSEDRRQWPAMQFRHGSPPDGCCVVPIRDRRR